METVGVSAKILGLSEYLAGARAITAANKGIGGSLDGLSGISTAFKALGVAIAGATALIGGAAVGSAIKYETTLAKIDALTSTTTEDTNKLGAGILKLTKSIPKSPDELGAAAYFALSSGIKDVDEALALVSSAGKAAAAGLGSTADIVDIVTAAMNAYGHENLTAARATDVLVATVREGKGEPAAMAQALGTLLPIAAALQIPIEDLAAVFASLTNALGGGGAAELAGTQLRGILSQLASPSKEAKDALAEAEAGVKHLSRSEIELADAHRQVVAAGDAFADSQRGIRDASEGIVQAQRAVRDANYGVESAQRSSRSATEALRNAYADLAAAQRNQTQASLDARRETLSVAEAEQGLLELRTQAGSHAQEVAAAELALAQARENASARGKKTALEQRQADLAVQQAQLRLNQVRAQGGRYALDLRNAELRLEETRSRVGTAQRQQAKIEVDAQKEVAKATQDVTDARRAEIRAREQAGDAANGLIKAYENEELAKRNSARASADLALAQEKEILAQIHTRDAYADLRKEIAEKGLVPTLQRLNTLFADNQEGLAKLFPDVRAFTGFLSAITSQGGATANILDSIKKSAGLTDEVFKRMSETTAFQASLLKNQLNVGLISLGSTALPLVTGALKTVLTYLPQITEFFKKGVNGTQIGGEFGKVQEAAFKAGEKVKELMDFIKENKDDIESVFSFVGETFLKDAKVTIQWFLDNKDAMAATFLLIGGFFALTNPAWAGILAGGAILLGIELLKKDLSELSNPLIQARIEVDKFLLRVLNAAEKTRETLLTIGTLGISNLPGVKDLLKKTPEQKAIDEAQKDLTEDIRAANSELAKRERLLNAEKEIQTRINVLQDEARAKAQSFDDALQVEVETMIRLGGATDGWARKLVDAAATVKGVDPSRIAYLRMELDEAEAAARATTTNVYGLAGATAAVNPPDVGDAGKGAIDEATAAAVLEQEATAAVRPPDVGDAGRSRIDAATEAGLNLSATLEDIRPPDVGDAGLGKIAAAATAAINEKNQLALIRPPNVGDAGGAAIGAAARLALQLRDNLNAAAAAASRIGSLAGAAASPPTRRWDGGVVSRPELAVVGDPQPFAVGGLVDRATLAMLGERGRPEVVLPLADPMRARDILGQLPKEMIRELIPAKAFEPMEEGGMVAFGAPRSKSDIYLNPANPFEAWMQGTKAYGGHSGSGGETTGTLGVAAGKLPGYSIPTADAGGYGGGGGSYEGGDFSGGVLLGGIHSQSLNPSRQVYATLPPSLVRSMGGGAVRSPNAPRSFESLFGDITIGSTSQEVEQIAVATVRGLFARARSQAAIGGGLLSGGIG